MSPLIRIADGEERVHRNPRDPDEWCDPCQRGNHDGHLPAAGQCVNDTAEGDACLCPRIVREAA